MQMDKKKLLLIARKVSEEKSITPNELLSLQDFEKLEQENLVTKFLSRVALPFSLAFGFFFTAFPEVFSQLEKTMPAWTNFSSTTLAGIDYLWDLLGEPVGKTNILYHVPNIMLYSVGFFGLKKLLDTIDKRTWLDKVLAAQETLRTRIRNGTINLKLKPGHSLLFVGKGDFIGAQFALNHTADETVTISEMKPSYTQIWSFYDVTTLYDDLKNVIIRSDGVHAGEYVFFPVKDDQIFLPNDIAYDLSPHKLDILCQNIRTIEKEQKWKTKRIIIIGDKFHKSFVQSEDRTKVIPRSADTISLESIAKKYKNVTLLDPSDIVIKKIIDLAQGRKIVFRATKEGIKEYKERFYDRLKHLGYEQIKTKKGVLTIGYDLFEDQTEQQTLLRKIDDYFPVVLSRNVHDALLRNGYKKSEFLYVPDLVLKTLSRTAAEQ